MRSPRLGCAEKVMRLSEPAARMEAARRSEILEE